MCSDLDLDGNDGTKKLNVKFIFPLVMKLELSKYLNNYFVEKMNWHKYPNDFLSLSMDTKPSI